MCQVPAARCHTCLPHSAGGRLLRRCRAPPWGHTCRVPVVMAATLAASHKGTGVQVTCNTGQLPATTCDSLHSCRRQLLSKCVLIHKCIGGDVPGLQLCRHQGAGSRSAASQPWRVLLVCVNNRMPESTYPFIASRLPWHSSARSSPWGSAHQGLRHNAAAAG